MCISQHDCAAKGGKVVTIPRAPRTTRAVDLATGPIPVGGFCRNDEGSRTVAMMAHRPVVGGRGRGEQKGQSRGEQKGQSRGVSWRFLMARPRSRLPGQARLVPLSTMRAAQWRSRRCPSAPMKISPWVRALMARPAPGRSSVSVMHSPALSARKPRSWPGIGLTPMRPGAIPGVCDRVGERTPERARPRSLDL